MKKIYLLYSLVFSLCYFSCEMWDLERIDFIQVEILNTQTVSISELQIEAQLEGLNNSKIIQHGFVWSALDSLPTKGNTGQVINLGAINENRNFSATLTNLSIETNYFIRAFVELEEAIIYSSSFFFVNENKVELRTASLKAIIGTSNALATGSITGLDANETIQQYGHCWSSINTLPQIFDNSNSLGNATGSIESYTSTIANLVPGETYFVRSYAIIADIVLYGPSLSITKGNYWVERSGLPINGVVFPEFFSIDGKGYFVYGEVPGGSESTALWEYTPETDTWQELSPCPSPWRYNGFTICKDKKIYIGPGGGGTSGQAPQYTDVWEYDIDTDTWEEKVPFPGNGRRETQDMNINGKLYMTFGYSPDGPSDDIWQFDPDWDNGPGELKGKWTLHSSNSATRRHSGNAFVIGDTGYLMSGFGPSNSKNQLWGFTPSAEEPWKTYSAFASLERHRFNSLAFTDGQKGYLGLGDGAPSDFWQFDPTGIDENTGLIGKWTQLAPFANGNEISMRRNLLGFAINGRIFVGFGRHSSNNSIPTYNDLWEYIADE